MALLVLIIGVIATTGSSSSTKSLTIFYTATANGNLEPCGCPGNPSGGVSRRAAYIRNHTRASEPSILLDGGDWVGPPSAIGFLQSNYMLRAMQSMGYKIVGVGPRDFAFGVTYLKQAEQTSGITITNANIYHGDTGEPLFTPWAIAYAGRKSILGIPYGGMKIGVISVLSGDIPPLCVDCDAPLDIRSPVESVKAAVSELMGKCDVIVVLAYAPMDHIEEISRISGVDAIIVSRTLYPPYGYENVGLKDSMAILFSGYQSRRIGHATLQFTDDTHLVSVDGDLVNLGERMPEDRGITRLIDEYFEDLQLIPGDKLRER
jgi:2',3'-cyclic-nucleotide 2'-phosphodiesterase (5'-nucleotidase family)